MAEENFQIYLFSKDEVDGDASMAETLGGKGANLAEMCKLGLPVPAGMTIPTDVCKMWQQCTADEKEQLLDGLMSAVLEGCNWVIDKQGNPMTLFSVRSGAPVSMPGMMDTILNVGICDHNLTSWINELGKRAALDTYRRLIQMLGSTAYGVPHEAFESKLKAARDEIGVQTDAELTVEQLEKVITAYKLVFQAATQQPFPQDWVPHMRAAIAAVFDSWMNERAVTYRQMYGISEAMGTAVTVQAMVFGNRNDKSASGVMFTRNPANGDAGMYGEFLINAQGEDVVAGIRTPQNIDQMPKLDGWKAVYDELEEISEKLEKHYRDMLDIEFTVDDGKLYMLQCRIGKRSAFAAIKIALDLTVVEAFGPDVPSLTNKEMFERVKPEQYVIATRPSIPASFKTKENGSGLPASPGVASGIAAFSAERAMQYAKDGNKTIMVTLETNPDDIGGMAAAEGILTSTGGATCHAAVVARGMDKPCVVGLTDLTWQGSTAMLNGVAFVEGDKITICGSTGRVWVQTEVPVADTSDSPYIAEFRKRAMEIADGVQLATGTEQEFKQTTYLSLDTLKQNPQLFLTAFEAAKQGVQMIIDVDDPLDDMSPATKMLGSMWDTQDAKQLVVAALHKASADAAKNVTLIGALGAGDKKHLTELGFKVGGLPKNVGDLLSMPMATITDDFVDQLFGSKKVFDQFKEMMAKAGQAMPKALGKPMHPDYAVFTALGGSGRK